jgi:hypothetical protein
MPPPPGSHSGKAFTALPVVAGRALPPSASINATSRWPSRVEMKAISVAEAPRIPVIAPTMSSAMRRA